jgi:hypothetical protein
VAKLATRKLKVFKAQIGFYDTVVAAPSQAAALRAWGMHQNLFASGQASVTDDPDAVKAALAHPETPLKRAIGSKDPFGLQARPPEVPDAPRPKAPAKPAAKVKPALPNKRPADRTALDAAEAALRKLDEARKGEEADFRRRQDELETAKAAAERAYVERRKAVTAAVVTARQAYRRAGGD